uniref:hypothetical protein n=1 Tax=Wolbachia endosymbiont (group A) of Lasioglossum morio TaxID=2954025 RepID=UPI0038735321
MGKSCNLKTVQSIMQKNGIQAILRRKFKIKKQQTDSSSQYIRPKPYCRSTKYSLSYNSPNAIRYVFMAIAGQ